MAGFIRVAFLGCCAGMAVGGPTTGRADDQSLGKRISAAPEGATVTVAAETISEPLTIDRSLTVRGKSVEESVLEVTADRPALAVGRKAEVTIESMTIRWQLESSEPDPGPPTAVSVRDGTLTLRDCRIVAMSHSKRCPSAVMADGFSHVRLENCTFEGFEFAVNAMGGAEAIIVDSVLHNPGHCGASVFADSTLTVERCLVTGSAYHGLRATGGTLVATDNLIIENKNRGIYLGNKPAKATIRRNAFIGNGTGISGFATTSGTIEENVFLDSEYSAIDSRDTCELTIRKNILQGNARGFVLFAESGRNRVLLGANTFWKNRTDTENAQRPADSLLVDPQFADVESGRLTVTAEKVRSAGHGLGDGAAIAKLWSRWKKMAADKPAAGSPE
jgi:Right handed beta helix region